MVLKWLVLIVDLMQSGGDFFVLSLRNNLSFGFKSQLSQFKTLSRKHIAGYAAEYCVVTFLCFWALLHVPSEDTCRL